MYYRIVLRKRIKLDGLYEHVKTLYLDEIALQESIDSFYLRLGLGSGKTTLEELKEEHERMHEIWFDNSLWHEHLIHADVRMHLRKKMDKAIDGILND